MNPKTRPTVIKKFRIDDATRPNSGEAGAGARGFTVRTECVGADVTGLVVRCGCGEEARIECVYDTPPAPPATA